MHGSGYFVAENNNSPVNLLEILEAPNKKIWLFLLDFGGYLNGSQRKAYVERILEIKKIINPKDKVVFVATKVDQICDFYDKRGRIIKENVFNELSCMYPNLVENFKNTKLFISMFRPYNFDFICFSACYHNGEDMYMPSQNIYPENLWKVILKNIK